MEKNILEHSYRWLFPNVGLTEILFSSLIFSASYTFSLAITFLYQKTDTA